MSEVSRALSGRRAMAFSSSSVMVQPVAKPAVRRIVFRSRRCSCRPWVAPAPSTRTRIFAVEAPGTWASASRSTRMWSATVFEPALPARSHIARHSPVFAYHAARGWKPNGFLQVAAAPCFFDAAVMIMASMPVTTQPCSRFPATVSHGSPPRRRCNRLQTCRRTRT